MKYIGSIMNSVINLWLLRFVSGSLLVCLSLQLQASSPLPTPAEIIRAELMDPTSSKVLVVAHRAAWKNAPENSLMSIQHAIDMGVDIIEIDIRQTKDGEFILMHDRTLERTTNGKGKVTDFSWDELKHLHLKQGAGRVKQGKEWVATPLTEHRIAHLRDALLLAKGKVLINFDKADTFLSEVYALARQTGTARQVVLKGKQGYYKTVAALQQGNQKFEGIYMPKFNFAGKKKRKGKTKQTSLEAQQASASNLNQTPHIVGKNNAKASTSDWYKGIEGSPMAEMKFSSLDQPQIQPVVLIPLSQKHRFWVNTLKVSHSADFTDARALQKPDAVWGKVLTMGYSVIQTDEPKALLDYLRKINRHN